MDWDESVESCGQRYNRNRKQSCMNVCLTVYLLALKAETKAPRFKCAARVAAAQSPT
jgi:hypothetical protein